MKYKIGDTLKEKVSGFEGVVMAVTAYATGCFHYGIASRDLDSNGKVKEWEWFDQSRLDLVESKTINFAIVAGVTSGALPNAPQS